jgi:hypothetical protein
MSMVKIPGRALKWAAACLVATVAPLLGGCTTTGILLGAAGVATDTSVTWEIVKHVHAKITEGDPAPCVSLNSAMRAVSPRCGEFVAGSLVARDIRHSQLQECPLAAAVRDPRLWPALPEFLDKGAQPEACARSPLVELAQAQGCPDFAAASPAVLGALRWLAEVDARAVHHDVVRMLSCPNARLAGLDDVLARWLAQGDLDPGKLGFGPLGALHPDFLATPFAQALEARGHTASGGLGAYDGTQPGGFEEALRTGRWAALDWWLVREPRLIDRVPPVQGDRLHWVPLARVLAPSFLADPASQAETVAFLLARGANPRQALPFDAGRSVLQHARALNSPVAPLLERPARAGALVVAATSTPMPGQ